MNTQRYKFCVANISKLLEIGAQVQNIYNLGYYVVCDGEIDS